MYKQIIHQCKTIIHLGTTVFALLNAGCSFDDAMKGQLGLVDDELTQLSISSPIATDEINWWNQAAFPVSGSCALKGTNILIKSSGVSAEKVLCHDDGTWVANLDFKNPGVDDGSVMITAQYDSGPLQEFQDEVTLTKKTYSKLFLQQGVSATEGSNLVFTVTLDHASDFDFSFDVATSDSTATVADLDYTSLSLTSYTIAAGVSSFQLTVTTGNDTQYENDETLQLALSNPTMSYIEVASSTATIVNDDIPPSIIIYDVSGSEGTTFNFLVSLSGLSTVNATFAYTTLNGTAVNTSDYTLTSGTGQITAGSTSTVISVPVIADNTYEDFEAFTVSLTAVSGVQISAPADAIATGSITNIDAIPNIFVSDVSGNEGTDLIFNVTLNRGTQIDFVFSWQTFDGTALVANSDYTAAVLTTVTVSHLVEVASLTVPTTADSFFENDENFVVSLSTVSGAAVGSAGVDNLGTGTILNDDAMPDLYIGDLNINEGTTGSMTVSLNTASGRDVIFTYQTYDNTASSGSDYTAVPATVQTITAGSTSSSLSLIALNDVVAEGNESFFVSLSAVSNANLIDNTGVATIVDSDVATLTIFDALTVNEGETLQFVVSISTLTASNVTFDWNTVDNTATAAQVGHSTGDYTQVSTQSASILAGGLSVTLSVASLNDVFVEDAETFFVSLSNLSGNSSTSDYLAQGSITSPNAHSSQVLFVGSQRSIQSGTYVIATSADAVNWVYEDLSSLVSGEFKNYLATDLAVYCHEAWYLRTNEQKVLKTTDFVTYTSIDISSVDAIVNNFYCYQNVLLATNKRWGSAFDVVRSTDGTTWTGVALDNSAHWSHFELNKDRIWTSKKDSGLLAYSDDLGLTFSTVTVAAGSPDFDRLVSSNGRLVVHSREMTRPIYYSDDDYLTSYSVTSTTGPTGNYGDSTSLDGVFMAYFFSGAIGHNQFYTEDFTTFTSFPATAGRGRTYYEGGGIYGNPSGGIERFTDKGRARSIIASLPSEFETINYGGADSDPGDFLFIDEDSVSISATLTSNPITISAALTSTIGVFASNGAEVSVNAGGFIAGWGAVSVTGGDVVEIRLVAPNTLNVEKTSTVRIGSRRDDWTLNTTSAANMSIVNSTSVTEGATAEIVVSLASTTTSDVTFSWTTFGATATTADSDYTAVMAPVSATIAAGVLQVTLSVATTSDSTIEYDETFLVSISNASSNASIVNALGTVTIINNDFANLSVSDARIFEGGTLDFVTQLSPASPIATVFNWRTYDNTATLANSDYSSVSLTTVTIAAGVTSVTLSVPTTDDTNIETSEFVLVSLSSSHANVTDDQALGDIITDDCEATGWCQQSYIRSVNGITTQNFGSAVGISGDTAIVGANSERSNQTTITNGPTASSNISTPFAGAAFIYVRSAGNWAQQAYLKPSNLSGSFFYGIQVDIDGDTAVVAALGDASNDTTITNGTGASSNSSNFQSGAAYVYLRTGTTWVQQAYIKPSHNHASMNFANAFELDGDTLVVGAHGEDSNSTTIVNGTSSSSDETADRAGAVFVYQRTGTAWAQQAYLKAPNAEAQDHFGSSVALDADTIVVGAEKESSSSTAIVNGTGGSGDNSSSESGAAYVFVRNSGSWSQQAYLKAVNSGAGDHYGDSVSVDGDTIVVGAPDEQSTSTGIFNGATASSDNSQTNAGAVYVYRRVAGSWGQEAYIKKPVNQDSYFGEMVKISGNRLVVGDRGDDGDQSYILNGSGASASLTKSNSGAVFVYQRTGSTWAQTAYLKASNHNTSSYGESLDFDGDSLVVGNRMDSSGPTTIINGTTSGLDYNTAPNKGAAFVYQFKGSPEVQIRQASTQADPTSSLPIEFEVKFSKPMNAATFTAADIALGSSSTASGITWNIVNSGDNRTFTLQATAVSTAGVVTPEIAAGVVTDPDGFTNLASVTDYDSSVEYSNLASLFISDAAGNEGDAIYFTAYLDVPTASARSINFSTYAGTAGASDFVSTSGTAVIDAGKQAAQIKVPTLQDAASEGNEIFYVSLSGASGFTNIIDDQAIGTIIDDDDSTPDLYVYGADMIESGNFVVFIVSLSSTPGSDVTYTVDTVDGSATAGTDYTAFSAVTRTMASGGSTTDYIYVPIQNDGIPEEAEYFTLNLSSISNANPITTTGVGIIVDTTYFGTTGTVTMSGIANPVNEGEVAELRLQLAEAHTADLHIVYKVLNGSATIASDFIAEQTHSYGTQAITIAAGDMSGSIFVETIEDGILESDETFIISLSWASELTSYSNSVGNAYTVTIANAPMPCPDEGWCQQAFIQPDKNVAGNQFGDEFDIFKDRLVVGVRYEDSDYTGPFTGVTTPTITGVDSNVGAAFVFERTGRSWAQTAYLKASNPGASDLFGAAIASDGDTVAVGTTFEDSDQTTITNGTGGATNDNVSSSGAVYVFVKSGATWEQQAYIKASNAETNDYFGGELALYGDTLVVGAGGEDSGGTSIINGTGSDTSNTASGSGAVYVYKRTGTTWAQEAFIKSPESASAIGFGSHISIDRDTLAVTALSAGTSASGKLYLFSRSGTTWSYSTALASPAPSSGDNFGSIVHLQDQTLVIGDQDEDSASTTIINGTSAPPTDDDQTNAGAVYVYRKSGTTWVQEAYIKPPVAVSGKFGSYVQLDGDVLAVGQYDSRSTYAGIINGSEVPENEVGQLTNGAVFVYKRAGSSWSQQAYIKPYVAASYNYFGNHLALDGDTLIGGMRGFEYNYAGIINSAQLPQENFASPSGGAIVFYRKGAPRVYIRPKSTQALTAASLPIEWDVTFSKEIVDATFTAGDLSLDGASTGSGVTWNLINSGDNRHYTLQATVISGSGTIIPVIEAGSVTDAQYNSNEASSPNIDSTVTYSP